MTNLDPPPHPYYFEIFGPPDPYISEIYGSQLKNVDPRDNNC